MKDVWEDTKDTIKGRGISYQAYEPAEGALHHDIGRQKRIRAGLRYSKGGKSKYWIPIPGDEARHRGETGPLTSIKRRVDARLSAREGYAPLLPKQQTRVIGEDPDSPHEHQNHNGLFGSDSSDSDAPSIGFESLEEDEDVLYDRARRIGYAGFPNVDVSKEEERRRQWDEEDGILAGRWNRGGGKSGSSTPTEEGAGKKKKNVYGACTSFQAVLGYILTKKGQIDRLHPGNPSRPAKTTMTMKNRHGSTMVIMNDRLLLPMNQMTKIVK